MLAMMCMVCAMGSMKLHGCIKGARQTLMGSAGKERVIAEFSQTGSISEQC